MLIFIFIIESNILSSHKSTTIYNNLQSINPINLQTQNKNDNSFKTLSDINPDYQFWIKVNNTNIDYPVVKGKDNNFYLENDIYKNKLKDGSIFADYRSIFNSDFNTILFGHNMKNANMFSTLNKFKDEDFFNSNNEITIVDDKNTYIYEVFSVYVVDATENFDYLYDMNKSNLSTDNLNSYTDLLKSKSLYKTNNPNITSNKKILTLITCSYEFDDARTIVHANLISKTENK